MRIFHYHPETGVLLNEGKADPSPLEPGVWLVPANATTKLPPAVKEGEQAVMVGKTWQVQPIPEPEPEPEPEPPPPSIPDYIPNPGAEYFQQMTAEQKLNLFGITVAELKDLFGLE